jgi:ion channel-forming bestrophin family protein
MKLETSNWFDPRRAFWSHVLHWDGSGEQSVTRAVLAFTIFAALVWFIDWVTPVEIDLGIAVAPYEFAGTILGALLVLRTNAGLDRWWEARKLWGGITNQSRNLAVIVLANGPDDPAWRREFIGWIVAFDHVTRRSLRGERATKEEVAALVGGEQA